MDSFALVRLAAGTACARASAACGNSVIHDWVNASHASCGGASCKSMCTRTVHGWFADARARLREKAADRTRLGKECEKDTAASKFLHAAF